MIPLAKLLEIRRRNAEAIAAGFEVRSHRHGEKGCRCISCYVTTGYVISSEISPTCDERPEARKASDGGCLEPVLDHHDAMNLLMSVADVRDLLAEIDRLNGKSIVTNFAANVARHLRSLAHLKES